MNTLFFFGSLRHRPLLDLVLGGPRDVSVVTARLRDHAVYWAKGETFPTLVAEPEGVSQGVLVSGLSEAELARLNFYEGGFDYRLKPVTVETEDGPQEAMVYYSAPGRWTPDKPWRLEDWERDWAAISLLAAQEAMSQFGLVNAAEMARWLPQMRVRAASKIRARGDSSAIHLRRGGTIADVETVTRRRPYSRFFAVEEREVRYRRFDGKQSDTVMLASYVMGDAVTVLPYDPVRDRVMLVEQFRFGPMVRGDRHPWSLEPIAGRIDPGETPEVAARREAQEEAGLQLTHLEEIARYYPSPGSVTEYIFAYVAIADLPDQAEGFGGSEDEAEDIRSLLLSFDELMQLIASGEAENGPLIQAAWWLVANRSRLRADT